MDSFWEEIANVGDDVDWLVKVKTHLDKIEKEQVKTKRKKIWLAFLKVLTLGGCFLSDSSFSI